MAGVRDEALIGLGPWPAGVNNVAPEHELPVDENGRPVALRSARNVDINNAGWPRWRDGYTNRITAARAHSLFNAFDNAYLLAVVDGDLRAYDPNLAESTLLFDIGARFATAAVAVDELYWSNGVLIRRFDRDLNDAPVWLDTPPAPALTAASTGGLAAGEYQVALTWRDARGRESGASPAAVVDVPANGGITLSGLPAAVEDAVQLRVYVSPPDSGLEEAETVLYHVIDLPAGQPMYVVGAHTPGRACETQWLRPLPPADILRFWNGRVLFAAANFFGWSEPLRFGLMHQDSLLRFGARITLMEPVGEGEGAGGVFIADHKRTYFLSGNTPPWNRAIRHNHPAVPGTSRLVPGNVFGLPTTAPVAVWLAANGVWCLGLPTGDVQPIRDGELALPAGERGTSVYREVNGIRQFMTSYLAGGAQTIGVSDSAVATIRRHGVTLD